MFGSNRHSIKSHINLNRIWQAIYHQCQRIKHKVFENCIYFIKYIIEQCIVFINQKCKNVYSAIFCIGSFRMCSVSIDESIYHLNFEFWNSNTERLKCALNIDIIFNWISSRTYQFTQRTKYQFAFWQDMLRFCHNTFFSKTSNQTLRMFGVSLLSKWIRITNVAMEMKTWNNKINHKLLSFYMFELTVWIKCVGCVYRRYKHNTNKHLWFGLFNEPSILRTNGKNL